MICRKATVVLPDDNPCRFKHKLGVFVSERAIFLRFLPLSSTKSGFLCSGMVIG